MDDFLHPKMKGEIIIDEDGKKHFILGKTRLNITEHFAENGKTFSEILDEVVLRRVELGYKL